MLQIQLHRLWLTLKSLPWDKASRYTLSIGSPLVIGFATGFLRYGVVALIGSLYVANIANVDTHPKDRLSIILLGSILISERVIFIFLMGGLWTVIVFTIAHWLFRSNSTNTTPTLSEGWQRIRSRQTAGWQFALCYGIVAAIAYGGSILLGLPRPFWVTATTLIVMKPDSRATVQRTSQRILGTLIGLVLVEAIITSNNPILLIAFILLSIPLIPIGLAKNYTLCCAGITVLVLVMIDLLTLTQGGDQALLPIRFYATLLGCMLSAIGTAIIYPKLWLHKRARDR